MKPKRIWIFGGVGSGKTTLARRITKKNKIPNYTTDDFVYKVRWSKKASEKEKIVRAKKISSKKSWIIEGVHMGEWIEPEIKKADVLVFLRLSKIKAIGQVIKRHWKRKRTANPDGIKELLRLIYWTIHSTKNDYLGYKKFFKKSKFIILSNRREINDFVEGLK